MGRQTTSPLALSVPGDEIGEQLQSCAVALSGWNLRREILAPAIAQVNGDGYSSCRRQRRIRRHGWKLCAK